MHSDHALYTVTILIYSILATRDTRYILYTLDTKDALETIDTLD